MKTLTLIFAFILLPLTSMAQTGGDYLSQVTTAISNKNWDGAVELFSKAIKADAFKSEMYYLTQVDKSSAVCHRLAYQLASFYQKTRNYDKAFLFYKELTQLQPNNVKYLNGCAEMEVMRGKEENALRLYERALELDRDNLAANIFIGNYYYLEAEKEKQKIETDFRKITTPTRMQYARYRDAIDAVVSSKYAKAKEYLQNVLRTFPSAEAQKTLNKILAVEKTANR